MIVGIEAPISGALSAFGAIRYATLAAFNYINDQGGINGYKFKAIPVDTAYNGAQTVSEARTLATQDKAMFDIVIGTTPVEAMRSIAPNLNMITLANGDGELLVPPVKNFFGSAPDFRNKDSVLIKYMHTLGISAMSLAYETDGIGSGVKETAGAYADQYGVKLDGTVGVAATTTNFAPLAQKLKQLGAPAVLTALGTTPLAGLQKAAAAIGYTPTWFDDWTVLGGSYINTVGKDLADSGVYVSSFELPVTSSDPSVQLYVQQTNKYYPGQATGQNQFGWDFAMMIADAVKTATSNGQKLTLDTARDAMFKISGRIGTMIDVKYSTDAPVPVHSMDIFKFVDGQPQLVTGPLELDPLPPGTKKAI